MKYRLGLDLGTDSIGWTVLALNAEREPESITDMGVRIFSDGRNPKTKEPLAVARRTARGIRRNLARKKQRRRNLFKQLQRDGLFPATKEEAHDLKAVNPYELRIKALDEKLEPYELGRALFHLGVRRGFKSNRKDTSEQKDTSKQNELLPENEALNPEKMTQAQKCRNLSKVITDSGNRTLGEFLWKTAKENNGIRFSPDRSVYYPLRSLYEQEFGAIRSRQERYYPDVCWDTLWEIIFTQRPLKRQERGKCQYMQDKERTFKAMPCSHRIRILQEVYNLKIYDALNTPHDLTEDQQDIIIQKLDTVKDITFDAVRKLLKTEGRFNLETENRTKLNGNDTARIMRQEKNFGSSWDGLTLEAQDALIELLITADEDEQIVPLLNTYELSDEQKKNILQIQFAGGTTSFCKELTENLISIMEGTNSGGIADGDITGKRFMMHNALTLLGFVHADNSVEACGELPYYGKLLTGSTIGSDLSKPESQPERKYGKIANPTVHCALNQIRVVVNALIKQYGKPDQIALEVSRELKASREAKAETTRKQAENQKRNKIENKDITKIHSAISYPNRNDRLKYRLWKELGKESKSRKCLYCGNIISENEVFTKNIEIEHILPFSRTLLDAESNKTVAHAHCNAKKGEKSPYEAFGAVTSGPYSWEEIMSRVNSLKNPQKRGRFAQDAMIDFEKDSAFIARQLTDNQYIARISLRYLKAICPDIWPVNGMITKLLRDTWEIDQILKRKITDKEAAFFNLKPEKVGEFKKNRYDHRHHALDSLVIGLTDRSLVQQIATANARSRRSSIEAPEMPICRTEIIEKVKGIVPSFKPDHGLEGKLSKETLLGCIKQEKTVQIKDLKADDIPNIQSDRVRTDFEEALAEAKEDLKKVKKQLADVYPSIRIFESVYVCRIPLLSLKKSENIRDIVDPAIREKLQLFADAHRNEKWEAILLQFSKQTGIKKLRCKNHDQAPICFPADKTNPLSADRYYGTDSYVCAVVWETPPEKQGGKPAYRGQFIRYDEIKADKKLPPKPKDMHPAAKKVCEIFKDDYIEFSEGGVWKKARIAGYDTTTDTGRLDIQPIFSAKDIKNWQIATNEQMLESGWRQADGHNYKSINILFGDLSARKITVTPTGRVHRKQ